RELRLDRSRRGHGPHPDRTGHEPARAAPRERVAMNVLSATLVLMAAMAAAAPGARAEPDRPGILRDVGFDQRLGAPVPLDLPFRDESGSRVTLGDYVRDKPVVLVPAYYECPMLCTIVLNGVVSALRALPFDVGREFRVVTVSFNPHETSELA